MTTIASARTRRRIVGAFAGFLFALLAISIAILPSGGWASTDLNEVFLVGPISNITVGTVILWRRPGHGVGQLMLAIGSVITMALLLQSLTIQGDLQPGPTPPLAAGASVVMGAMLGLFFLGTVLMIVWFPDGRRTSRLGGLVEGLIAVAVIGLALTVLRPGPLEMNLIGPAVNPFGIDGLDPAFIDGVTAVMALLMGLAVLLSAIDLSNRYRHSDGVRRAQIRWVLAAAGLSGVLFPALFVEDHLPGVPIWELWLASIMLWPVAIAIAILRYRLYDIDRIISRTISYTVVTAVLFTTFAGLNLILQGAIRGAVATPDAELNPLVVAASTLAVAALFSPVRSRVQAIVDRRFHRARYDAERTVGGFAGRLRDELDLPTLTGALRGVAIDTVEPMTSGVWLRATGAER